MTKKNKKCSIWWCGKRHYALGYCKPHWAGMFRYGSPYGRHAESMAEIDKAIRKARSIAEAITEFVDTEFAKDFLDNGHRASLVCPFCKREYGVHDLSCAYISSKSFLDATRYNNDNKQKGE